MEKSRKNKKIVLVALLLLVVALSIGFAAFSSQLTISSSAAVKGDTNTFKVAFSESDSELTGNTAKATTSGAGATAEDGTFSGTELTGLKANFTGPGQSVTWSVYAYNEGAFDAFLNQVKVGKITCTAGQNTTQSYVDEAAKGISVKVTVGGDAFTATTIEATSGELTNNVLSKQTAEEVLVTIEYAAGSSIADGDFEVQIDPIQLSYSSVD